MSQVYGDGILKTHVTWEDLQEKLKDVFGENAVLGPKRTATDIGTTRGYMSRICLIDPDWLGNVDAPTKFVVKIASQAGMVEAGQKFTEIAPDSDLGAHFTNEKTHSDTEATFAKLHNTEVVMYKLIEKYHINIPHPKIYAMVSLGEIDPKKGYIIMDHIEHASNHHIWDNTTVEEVKQPLRGIAALEAASVQFTEDELQAVEHDMAALVKTLLNPQGLQMMLSMMGQVAGPIFGDKMEKFGKLATDVIDCKLLSDLGEELGMKKVLVHGDIWSTNLLWKQKDGSLNLEAVIDFQHGNLNTPAVDLVRLFGSCLSGKDRQENWESLLDTFYGYLKEELKGSPAPYTLEQLKENYRRFLPFGGLLVVMLLGGAMLQVNMGQDSETAARVMEKIGSLISDMVEQHEANLAREAEKK